MDSLLTFFQATLAGLIAGEVATAAQTAITLGSNDGFERISPFLVGSLGAFLTYFFTARHERVKAAESKQERRRELAVALSSELEAVSRVIRARIDALDRLSRANQNGGHTIEKSHASQLYDANLSTLGILGNDALRTTIEAYKFIVVMPKTVRLRAGVQDIHTQTFEEISVAPQSDALRSVIDNHENVHRSITAAIQCLSRLSSGD